MIIRDYSIHRGSKIYDTKLHVPYGNTIGIYEGTKIKHVDNAVPGSIWLETDLASLNYIDLNKDHRRIRCTHVDTPVQQSTKPKKKSKQEKAPVN